MSHNENVFSHVMECTLLCSAISGVRYSQFALLFAFDRARDYSCFGIYRHSFAVQGHSTASLVIFLSIFFYFCRLLQLLVQLNQFNYRKVRYLEIYVVIQDVLT